MRVQRENLGGDLFPSGCFFSPDAIFGRALPIFSSWYFGISRRIFFTFFWKRAGVVTVQLVRLEMPLHGFFLTCTAPTLPKNF